MRSPLPGTLSAGARPTGGPGRLGRSVPVGHRRLRRRRAGRWPADRPHRLASRRALDPRDRDRGARSGAAEVLARSVSPSAGCRGTGPRRTTCSAGSPSRSPASSSRATSSSRCGWRACSPRAPGRGGPRSGSWSTANRSWRPPGPRRPGPDNTGRTATSPACDRWTSRSTARGSASCGSRSAATSRCRRSRSACSPVSRPRRAWCFAVLGSAPTWRSGPRTWRPWPRTSRPRADASSTPTTPNGGAWNATSTTGPSNTWSRSWSTSASPTP